MYITVLLFMYVTVLLFMCITILSMYITVFLFMYVTFLAFCVQVPPGANQIAVNKYHIIWYEIFLRLT